MLITPRTNNVDDIPQPIRHYAWEKNREGNLPLTPGKKYVVSGLRFTHNYSFYLIIADENERSGRPWWYPTVLFDVLDATEPDDWVEYEEGDESVRSFAELALDKSGIFQNNLEDGEPQEKGIFLKHYEKYARAHNLWYIDGKPGDRR